MTPDRHTFIRRALLGPRAPTPIYPVHTTLSARQLRMLMAAESLQALEFARAAGLEVPRAHA